MMWGFRRLKWCNVRSDVLSIAVARAWGMSDYRWRAVQTLTLAREWAEWGRSTAISDLFVGMDDGRHTWNVHCLRVPCR